MAEPGRVSDSLVRRGLLRQTKRSRACRITPAGLRALADELEAGRVEQLIDARLRDRHQ